MTAPSPAPRPDPARPENIAAAGRPAEAGRLADAAGAGARAAPLLALRHLLDRLLVANVFVVLLGALWFMLAVALHSQGVEAPLQGFQSLWEPVFTPALGLLMAGALISGALGWWQRRGPR